MQIDHSLSWKRIVLAILGGAAVGGVSLSLLYYVGVVSGRIHNPEDGYPGVIPVYSLFGSALYLVGILAVSPAWYVMHRCRLRQWRHFSILGASTVGLVYGWMLFWTIAKHIWDGPALMEITVLMLLIGIVNAVVGYVVWRIAYRPASAAAISENFG